MRKSVSFLTSIRQNVTATIKEMAETALDFSHATEDMEHMSPELIRTDQCMAYKEMMQAERALQKAIRAHKIAVKQLKEFF
jgi:hypothetical protein